MSKTDDHQDLLRDDELWGDSDTFTEAQRRARETFVKVGLALPRSWLEEIHVDGISIDADPAGRLATTIFGAITESGCVDPRFPTAEWDADDWRLRPSFAGILERGGDAYLWALIRIGIGESLAGTDEVAETLEAEGFIVRLPRRRPAGPPKGAAVG
jgi:hypothetical protein